jgi:hypothetical protein
VAGVLAVTARPGGRYDLHLLDREIAHRGDTGASGVELLARGPYRRRSVAQVRDAAGRASPADMIMESRMTLEGRWRFRPGELELLRCADRVPLPLRSRV